LLHNKLRRSRRSGQFFFSLSPRNQRRNTRLYSIHSENADGEWPGRPMMPKAANTARARARALSGRAAKLATGHVRRNLPPCFRGHRGATARPRLRPPSCSSVLAVASNAISKLSPNSTRARRAGRATQVSPAGFGRDGNSNSIDDGLGSLTRASYQRPSKTRLRAVVRGRSIHADRAREREREKERERGREGEKKERTVPERVSRGERGKRRDSALARNRECSGR